MTPQSGQSVNRSGFSRTGKEVGLRSGTDNLFEGKIMARVRSSQLKVLQYFGLYRPLVIAAGVFAWGTKNISSAILLLQQLSAIGVLWYESHPWRKATYSNHVVVDEVKCILFVFFFPSRNPLIPWILLLLLFAFVILIDFGTFSFLNWIGQLQNTVLVMWT
jgi:hypothetical protein